MSDEKLDSIIDTLASDLLERLSEIMPGITDAGELGELVLLRALEAYKIVLESNL